MFVVTKTGSFGRRLLFVTNALFVTTRTSIPIFGFRICSTPITRKQHDDGTFVEVTFLLEVILRELIRLLVFRMKNVTSVTYKEQEQHSSTLSTSSNNWLDDWLTDCTNEWGVSHPKSIHRCAACSFEKVLQKVSSMSQRNLAPNVETHVRSIRSSNRSIEKHKMTNIKHLKFCR